ncbi:MAG: glycosyltransferase family 4 protein [Deltaproteobacteria bacterium]|nr:glycosyltransferase family 4 protein [Deltaproteobacteria bacterium]
MSASRAALRILYVAPGVRVPGQDGGSSHTAALTRALARRGHLVNAFVRGVGDEHRDGVLWVRRRGLFEQRYLEWTAASAVAAEVRRCRAEVVVERYSSFGGAGVRAAARLGLPALLEVNSPAFDPPESLRGRIDGWIPGRPVHRYREWVLDHAAFVYATSPHLVAPERRGARFRTVTNGFDPERFRPDGERAELGFPPHTMVFVLVSSFRGWHGARELVEAGGRLAARGRRDFALALVGDGPERAPALALAERHGLRERVWAPGAVSPSRVPEILRGAHVGVAPFATARHPDLAIGFFWSPIKLFEYMGTGLPVITTRLDALERCVRHGVEGLLIGDGAVDELAAAMERLLDDRACARAMGAAARARALAEFTWDAQARVVEDLAQRAVVAFASSPRR